MKKPKFIGRKKKTLNLGGRDGERLYLHNLKFKAANGREICVRRTAMPDVNMRDLIARAKGRYGLLALFSRPGYRILDFPCGSGYAADLLKEFGVIYEGRDVDGATIEYAKRIYGGKNASFKIGNLCLPKLGLNQYDLIGCIEGLEHIDKKYQGPLLNALYGTLKPGGTLIISSPENTSGVSGPSESNTYHKWELTRDDFLALLYARFKPQNVELITYKAVLSFGSTLTTCFFGICRKKK